MKFEITFKVEPSAPFGVPQEGYVVRPGKPESIHGPTIHFRSGTVVGHGTLSQYREEGSEINLVVNLAVGRIRFHDNYAFVEIEATTPDEAFASGSNLLDRFLKHFSLSKGTLFSAHPLVFESEDQKLYPVPEFIHITRVTTYNLENLEKDLLSASQYQSISDVKLEKAFEYYEQALLLYINREKIAPILSRQHSLLISSAFLNLWKAVSVLVGDPSTDNDYQRRYRGLGFDIQFFTEKIEKLRALRNNYDIAHYSVRRDDLEQIEAAFGEANTIATEVIKRYREKLIEDSKN